MQLLSQTGDLSIAFKSQALNTQQLVFWFFFAVSLFRRVTGTLPRKAMGGRAFKAESLKLQHPLTSIPNRRFDCGAQKKVGYACVYHDLCLYIYTTVYISKSTSTSIAISIPTSESLSMSTPSLFYIYISIPIHRFRHVFMYFHVYMNIVVAYM